PGNTSTVALNCLTEICGPGVVSRESRPGREFGSSESHRRLGI
nr:hypothetical protein [Tanacetum cinerariifolium]